MAGLFYVIAHSSPPLLGYRGNVESLSDFDSHLTVLPAFQIAESKVGLFRGILRELVVWFDPISVVVSGFDVFKTGDGVNNVPVCLLKDCDMNNNLFNLHFSLVDGLLGFGGSFSKDFFGNNFNPHVSFLDAVVGDVLVYPCLTLVNHCGGFGKDIVYVENFMLGS